MKQRATRIGRAGEFWAAHMFEKHGMEAHVIDGSFDLIVMVNDTPVKVEVKSATKRHNGCYNYTNGGLRAEYYVLIAFDQNLMRIVHRSDMSDAKNTYINHQQFTEFDQANDLMEFAQLNGGTLCELSTKSLSTAPTPRDLGWMAAALLTKWRKSAVGMLRTMAGQILAIITSLIPTAL